MGEGPRAEDMEVRIEGHACRCCEPPHVMTDAEVAEMARAWLASQEQTPDIAISRDENGEWPEWAALLVTAVTPTFNSHLLNENIGFAFLDALAEHDKSNPAALVGFHPQPEGDERDERPR